MDRYEEALERAKAGKPLDEIFPQLKESEDERIRKEIIQFFKDASIGKTRVIASETFVKWAEFFEKQKDDKFAPQVLPCSAAWFEDGEGEGFEQKEQKPTELPKGEDYGIDGLYRAIDILEKTLGEVDGYQTDDGILEHKCAISAVKELYEQQPAEWSEDFEENIRNLLHNKLTWHSEDGSMSSAVFIDDKTLKDIVNGIWFYVDLFVQIRKR